jgi:phenylacetate-CoA ligase
MRFLKYLPRFKKAYAEMIALEKREGWSRTEIETYQLDRINALWRHATSSVPFYQKLKERLCLSQQFSSLEEFKCSVQPLPSATIKAHPRLFFSNDPEKGSWHRTGGSTGIPADAYWGHASHLQMLRAKYRWFSMWGIDIFDPTVFLWGHGASFDPGLAGHYARIRQPIEDTLRNRMRLSAYHLGKKDLQLYLRKIQSFRPLCLYGYSNATYLLALEAKTTEFQCESLRLSVLTAEPAYKRIVVAVESAFGAPAVSEYGSIETGFIAGEWVDRTLRVREDLAFVETISREDGRYDIAITVLTNPSFPLIRYLIEDVTDSPIQAPDTGFSILKNIAGRQNDVLVTRSGRLLHPTLIEEIFEHTHNVRRYQVVQKKDSSVIVQIEKLTPTAHLDETGLVTKLTSLMEGLPLQVNVVRKIPPLTSGKHRWIMSEMETAGRTA